MEKITVMKTLPKVVLIETEIVITKRFGQSVWDLGPKSTVRLLFPNRQKINP